MSVNKVIIIGNVGKEPKFHTFDNGSRVAAVSVATTEKWLDKNKQWQEETQWHRLTLSGFNVNKLERVKVGTSVYAEGKLTYRKFTDKNNVERMIAEIEVESFEVLANAVTKTQPEQPVAAAASEVKLNVQPQQQQLKLPEVTDDDEEPVPF